MFLLDSYTSFPTAAPVSGIDIDDYSDKVLGLSLRKVSSSYAGNCVKVRRSTDNATQDIGFTGGLGTWLDDSALNTFLGGADAFVDTWYDQSGNGYDVTQATLSEQPQLVADVFVLSGGTAYSMSFDGANATTLTVDTGGNNLLTGDNHTMLTAYRLDTNNFSTVFGAHTSLGTASNRMRYLRYSTAGRWYTNGTNNALEGVAGPIREHALLEWDGTLNSWTANDGTPDTATTGSNSTCRYFTMGGGASTTSQCWGGEFGEYLWWESSLNSIEIDAIRDNQNATYSLY